MFNRNKSSTNWWLIAFLFLISPLLLVFVVLAVLYLVLYSMALHLIIWSMWCSRGRDILFVYSDSPMWREHIEQNILPTLGSRAVILNWSERKQWRPSLATLAFAHFGGPREFNPLAVVFRPFRPTRTFRFWQPFRDFKHGNPESLCRIEREFAELIGVR